jgi:hypothetical protein
LGKDGGTFGLQEFSNEVMIFLAVPAPSSPMDKNYDRLLSSTLRIDIKIVPLPFFLMFCVTDIPSDVIPVTDVVTGVV